MIAGKGKGKDNKVTGLDWVYGVMLCALFLPASKKEVVEEAQGREKGWFLKNMSS